MCLRPVQTSHSNETVLLSDQLLRISKYSLWSGSFQNLARTSQSKLVPLSSCVYSYGLESAKLVRHHCHQVRSLHCIKVPRHVKLPQHIRKSACAAGTFACGSRPRPTGGGVYV